MQAVTRFAPSPTGLFHAGSYRTALFAYIFARQNKGKFILRIEDTDKERSRKEYEDNIMESLAWLGLSYDEFYRQSERTGLYTKYVQKLIDTGHAYVSKETPKEPGDREEVIRFKNPNKKVSFDDLIRGHITFDTTELGDFVIAKSMDEPVFHLVNVVDDIEMGMTHIIRGEDHISNTPRQILIYEALGASVPMFAHIPLLLAPDRSKLSKRHGALSITEYRSQGYLPSALVNYMALLGWHPADEKEIMSLDDIIDKFSLDRVQKSGAIFDVDKLKWFNKQYISGLSDEQFSDYAVVFLPEWLSIGSPDWKRMLPTIKEKVTTLADISALLSREGELGFIRGMAPIQAERLLWKKEPDRRLAAQHVTKVIEFVSSIPEGSFNTESVRTAVWNYAEAKGKGNVLWPMRMALTGQDKSPDPFTCAHILGRKEALKRLEEALKALGNAPSA